MRRIIEVLLGCACIINALHNLRVEPTYKHIYKHEQKAERAHFAKM